ncbi:MAG: methylthioribulose 1-phosphate dehydratase [Algiphilus sp.]
MNIAAITDELISAGHLLHRRGWVPASGGNFSARLAPNQLLMTASGCHKGELSASDFMVVDDHGQPGDAETRRASAETLLHCAIYRFDPTAAAVLHTHSVPATVLSRALEAGVMLRDYELLKILDGISTHEVSVEIPIFDNDQNMTRLSAVIEQALHQGRGRHGFLIRGHGLYAWGSSVAEARYRVEALEFLFDCEWQSQLGEARQ